MSVDEAEHNVAATGEAGAPSGAPRAGVSIVDGGSGAVPRNDIDAPLFVRTDRVPTGQLPVLRNLTWEHVSVRAEPDLAAIEAHTEAAPAEVIDESAQTDQEVDAPAAAAAEVAAADVDVAPAPSPAPDESVARLLADRLWAGLDKRDVEKTVEPAAQAQVDHVVEAVAEPTVAPVVERAVDRAGDQRAPSSAPPANASRHGASVDDEINRLAYVPDMTEEELPANLPPIMFAGADTPGGATGGAAVSLDASSGFAPRSPASGIGAVAAPVNDVLVLPPNAARPAPAVQRGPGAFQLLAPPPARRRKRRIVPTLFKMVLLLGLIGGGLYVARTYLLMQDSWSDQVQPLVDRVERVTGLEFDEPVAVREVEAATYATELAALIPTSVNLATLQRLGMAGVSTQQNDIGVLATLSRPAFYDPAKDEIVVISDLPDKVYELAMYRALAAALFDQQLEGGLLLGDAYAEQTARVALADAVGYAVAQGTMGATDQQALVSQIFELAPTLPVPTVGAESAYISAVRGQPGLPLVISVSGLQGDALLDVVDAAQLNDAVVYDQGRAGTLAADAPLSSQGMLFWYHLLAVRIDPTEAWQVATGWASDRLVDDQGCTVATFDALTPELAARAGAALADWVSGAEQAASWSATSPTTVQLRVCGNVTPTTSDVPLFGGAAVEAMLARGTAQQRACVTAAFRASSTPWNTAGNAVPLLGTAPTWNAEAMSALPTLTQLCPQAVDPAPAPVPAPTP